MDPTAEIDIRNRAGGIALAWYEATRGPFLGSDAKAYGEMVVAAHIAADESKLALHRWVDAARRADLGWSEIGRLIGISKQAAQQRFGSGERGEPAADDEIIVCYGATAFNEMDMLKAEGEAGRELIDTGFLKLLLRQTDRTWEYQRVTALFPDRVRRKLESEGWTWVSTWHPFHFYKRETGAL